jgi:hypothetical protein
MYQSVYKGPDALTATLVYGLLGGYPMTRKLFIRSKGLFDESPVKVPSASDQKSWTPLT